MDTLAVMSLWAFLVQVWIFGILFGCLTLWRLFTKAGQPGWSALIPVYNIYLLTRVAGKSGWWTLMIFLPPITLVALPVVLLSLGKSFGKLPQYGLFPPFLADGAPTYVGNYPADSAVTPSPRRGAFLTSVLMYLFIGLFLGTIGALVGQRAISAVLLLTLLLLTYAIWRWKRWATYGFLVVFAANLGFDFLALYSGPRSMYVVLFGLLTSLFPAILLLLALPIGRRLAGVQPAT